MRNSILKTFITAVIAATLSVGVAHAGASPKSVDGATTISTTEAKTKFDQGVLFVDVRSKKYFKRRHVPGAKHLSISKADFTREALASFASPSSPMVIYCKGAGCALSSQAVTTAVGWGYTNLFYYREGMTGWVDAGYPTE